MSLCGLGLFACCLPMFFYCIEKRDKYIFYRKHAALPDEEIKKELESAKFFAGENLKSSDLQDIDFEWNDIQEYNDDRK